MIVETSESEERSKVRRRKSEVSCFAASLQTMQNFNNERQGQHQQYEVHLSCSTCEIEIFVLLISQLLYKRITIQVLYKHFRGRGSEAMLILPIQSGGQEFAIPCLYNTCTFLKLSLSYFCWAWLSLATWVKTDIGLDIKSTLSCFTAPAILDLFTLFLLTIPIMFTQTPT